MEIHIGYKEIFFEFYDWLIYEKSEEIQGYVASLRHSPPEKSKVQKE